MLHKLTTRKQTINITDFLEAISNGYVERVQDYINKASSSIIRKESKTLLQAIIKELTDAQNSEELFEDYLQILKMLLNTRAISMAGIEPLQDVLRFTTEERWESRGWRDSAKADAAAARILKVLLADRRMRKNALVDAMSISAFSMAMNLGYAECMKVMIADMEMDVNAAVNSRHPLIAMASWSDKERAFELCELLLARKDVDVNREYAGDTALDIAIACRNQKLALLLAAHKDLQNVNQCPNGSTYLITAIKRGLNDVVDVLLARDDIDVNAPDADGTTPLMWAALSNPDAARKLLARADIKTTLLNKLEKNVLFFACKHIEILDLLLHRPEIDAAAINCVNVQGEIPLFAAIISTNKEAANRLLDTGKVLINHTSKDNYTALILAACCDKHDLAMRLLAMGADASVAANDGHDALMTAIEGRDYALAKALLEHGANPNLELKNEERLSTLEFLLSQSQCEKTYDFIDLLVEYGADLTRKNPVTGMRPCELAADMDMRGISLRLLRLESEGVKPKPVSVVGQSIFKPESGNRVDSVPVAEVEEKRSAAAQPA